MTTFGWLVWGVIVIVSAYSTWDWAHRRNAHGVWGMATPAGWVWPYNVLMAFALLLLGKSPWHLLWLLPVGWVALVVIGRILYQAGLIRL